MEAKKITNSAKIKAKQIEKEIELKLGMLTDGVCIDASATAGYGAKYKEQKKWLFEWDHVTLEQKLIAEEVLLPEGTIVGIREDPDSRYMLKAENGQLMVLKDGQFLMEASHIPRSDYYSKI